ncbi:tyrosine-type recombinase/integrase [Gordonia sp. DT30]|uniref:tyrosine-type recombinase/integrase n=1 Tax=Gordonia sp. DT30 TaxID=3416546 RepID=UPI003CFB3562
MADHIGRFLYAASEQQCSDLLECFRSHKHAVGLRGVRTVGILILEKAHRRFEGYDSLRQNPIYLQDLPLRTTQSQQNPDLAGTPIDTSELTQPWLEAGFRAWLGATLETRGMVQHCFAACALASEVLRCKRSDAGVDPTRLAHEDMAAISSKFVASWTYSTSKIRFAGWWDLCLTARKLGIWDDVPASFSADYLDRKRIKRGFRKDRKVESDRTIPPIVIAHLRNHIGQLSVGRHSAMYRCILELLFDTGRRPAEIATLQHDCLIQDRHGGWLLRYTAHKTDGAERELPVGKEVAESIRRWKAEREAKEISTHCLFPTGRLRQRSNPNAPPVSSIYINKILQKFCATIPPVPGPVVDADGDEVNFDLATITAYDLRRAYAQRHADNGTEPDVLRQLMDHSTMTTTMVYYQVNSKRRREAVSKLAPLAHDRHGNEIGISQGRIQLKITPVPYGDCAEPTNVAAGGTACQLRYQCAGCGFFRPNPSHIPAIEKEIVKLRSQLRIAEASDTADYLLDAQRGLIADYTKVLTTMKDRLDQLPAAERTEIEAMAEIARRARSAALAGKKVELREL